MFSKLHILCLSIIFSNTPMLNATTATALVSICIKDKTPNKVIMPGTISYKREIRKICAAFGIHHKLEPSPLVRVKITQNDRKKVPRAIARLSYLPFAAFKNSNKRDWITPYGNTYLCGYDESCLEIIDSHGATHAKALRKVAKFIQNGELPKTQRRMHFALDHNEADESSIKEQQRMLDHFTRLNAQREARLIAIAAAESKKMNTKEEPAVDDERLPTTEEIISDTDEDEVRQFLEEDTDSEKSKPTIAQLVESSQLSPADLRHRLSIEQRLSAPLTAQSDDDDHVDHVG